VKGVGTMGHEHMQTAADFYRAYIYAERDFETGPLECRKVWASFLCWLARKHKVGAMGSYLLEELGTLAREFGYHRPPNREMTPFDFVDDAYGKLARLVIATSDRYAEEGSQFTSSSPVPSPRPAPVLPARSAALSWTWRPATTGWKWTVTVSAPGYRQSISNCTGASSWPARAAVRTPRSPRGKCPTPSNIGCRYW